MSFSYTFNTGFIENINIYKTYLQGTFGFSNASLAGATDAFVNEFLLAKEYEAKFGKTLAISEDYKFLDDPSNENYMGSILNNTSGCDAIAYDSTSAVSRIDVYKEMFLEQNNILGLGAGYYGSSDLGITNGSYSTYDLSGISTREGLSTLYTQLETEANILKGGLNTRELAYGGYPEIGYSSTDAEINLLQKQMEATTQQFMTLYDDMAGYFKIKAGGHNDDYNLVNSVGIRGKEAYTAAIMTASIAIQYAEKYYSQSIKPTAADYAFGQAGIVLSGKTSQLTQEAVLNNSLQNYANVAPNNLKDIFDNNASGYQIFNKAVIYKGTNNYASNMTANSIHESNGAENKLTTEQFQELGGTIPTYISWMVRDAFGVGGVLPDAKDLAYCREDSTFIAKEIVAVAEKLVDLKMQIQTKVIEASINNRARAEYEARVGAMEAIEKVLSCASGTDPYSVIIDGQEYILGQDNNADGTINNITEILGIKDTQENIFESLKNLDTNTDGYVSQEEMKAHNIILNAVDNESGQLKNVGYDMSLVKGISLADLQSANGTNNIFGRFTMDLQDKKVNGNLTFEDKAYFDKLFASNVDFSVLSEYDSINSSDNVVVPPAKTVPVNAQDAETEAPASEEPVAENLETAETEPKTYSLFDAKNFSFDFVGAEDNKSIFEKMLDQLAWQMNINSLTNVQRYNILDSIDSDQDVTLAKAEIQQELEKINLSA